MIMKKPPGRCARLLKYTAGRFEPGGEFLKMPVLIIWGSADRSTPVQDAYQLKNKIPGSVLEVIDNCGHNPHLTQPAELCRMTDAFLKSATPLADPRD